MATNPKYKFNLTELEVTALKKYSEWTADDNQETRTSLFVGLRELAFAILSVGARFKKYGLDYDQAAYEYALYMFERLIVGSFQLVSKTTGRIEDFPLQFYVNKNINHVIFTMTNDSVWSEVITDLEFLLEGNTRGIEDLEDSISEPVDFSFDKARYGKRLLKTLRIFYTYEEIRRLLSVSLDHIYSNYRYLISPSAPKDIQDFSIVLIAVAKRLTVEHNFNFSIDVPKSDVKRMFAASVRSTVFLAAVVNSNFFPKELLLTLDIDSLYRICSVVGGKQIRIPTMRELDTLIGSVVAASKVIMDGKDPKDVIGEAKGEFDLVFTNNINTQNFVSKILETYDVFKDNSNTEPLIGVLAMSIKSMDLLFQQIQEKSEDISADASLKMYAELSTSFSKFTESLISMKDRLEKPKDVS